MLYDRPIIYFVLVSFKSWRDKLLLVVWTYIKTLSHNEVNKLSVEGMEDTKIKPKIMNHRTLCFVFSKSIRPSLLYVLAMLLWRCECDHGYTGSHCETEVNLCLSSPCQNNATCISQVFLASVQCLCPPGYGGKYCETCK